MQLFTTEFEKSKNNITINNKEISHQMKKVLRMKSWDLFFVQAPNVDYKKDIDRYQVSIKSIESNTITGIITKTETHNAQTWDNEQLQTMIAIAMPNKRSKAELIVQKLSELWINKIYFWPSERSIIKQTKDKKIDRLIKIAQEAVEQSRWRHIPHIEFIKDISKLTHGKKTKTIIFDKSNKEQEKNITIVNTNKYDNILWIIWPEWWLTQKDYQKIWDNYTTKQLWETILRTETASIIAWWIIKSID